MPKSRIFTSPVSESMMLAGLMSRWTTWFLCALVRPSAVRRRIDTTSGGGSVPCLSTLSSGLPSKNSITM